MTERRGTKGLELWCRRMTEGYPGVEVNNMTTSWRNGLAFCAIIHHFRPDLIDFAKLNKDDIYYNNDLAFQVAERHLGIPALLEPEDMVEYAIPDRLSILTYLSQFYQTFVVAQGSPSRIVPKRPANASDRGVVSPTSTSPTSKMFKAAVGRARRESCAKCGLPVFIAERLNVGKHLYHRTCFRCARCNSQLTLANYYETETENQFCCEICPDEEPLKENKEDSDLNEKLALSRSLSDEEKSAVIQKFDEHDVYSSMLEAALEDPDDQSLSKNYTLNREEDAVYRTARSRFFTSQLAESEDESSENEVPDLPKSEPPALPKTKPPDLKSIEDSENTESVDKTKDLVSIVNSEQCESLDSGCPSRSLDSYVHSSVKLNEISDKNQPETATEQLDINKIVTKENKFQIEDNGPTSLVKSRMRLFETKFTGDQSNDQFKPKSAEKKFIYSKVPSEEEEEEEEEEEDSSTGLENKKFDVKVEFDASVNVNLVDEVVINENTENRTEQKCKIETQEDISIDEKSDEPIIITSDTSEDIYKNNDSIVEVSDSLTTDYMTVSSSIGDEKSNEPIVLSSSSEESVSKHNSHSGFEIADSLTSEYRSVDSAIDNEDSDLIVYTTEPTIPTTIEISDIVKSEEEYPEDLNPFGDDDVKMPALALVAATSLNPFGDDDDEDELEERKPSPKPAVRKKLRPKASDLKIVGTNSDTPECLAQIRMNRISYNPFDDQEDEEIKNETRPKMRIIPAPRISVNPFWSDGEEPDDEEKPKPVPLPRNSRSTIGTPEPKPRKSGLSLSSAAFGSNTSLSSAHSSIGPAGRKKKQAPKPPSMGDKPDSAHSSVTSSPAPSVQHSPKSVPRVRKIKKAPLPPFSTSTPYMVTTHTEPISTEVSPMAPPDSGDWEQEKIIKDEVNRNRQSQITSPVSSNDNSSSIPAPSKSTYGKWKRRKGPAPSRPIPQRRHIKPLPVVEIKRELDFIEIQQQGLEKQGVRLEQIIREKCEGPQADVDTFLPPEVEDLILQLFELVNEKNDLFRKQTELMYLRRQQRLEEEHADLEYQIHCLMAQPEANKTDHDKAQEEELINRLVEVVERRNEIVECLEMDRMREAEEDDSINNQLNLYVCKREEELGSKSNLSGKQKKKNKKEKKFKFKTSKKMDIDKDIDESESSSMSSPAKDKDKKKKKFNIF